MDSIHMTQDRVQWT